LTAQSLVGTELIRELLSVHRQLAINCVRVTSGIFLSAFVNKFLTSSVYLLVASGMQTYAHVIIADYLNWHMYCVDVVTDDTGYLVEAKFSSYFAISVGYPCFPSA